MKYKLNSLKSRLIQLQHLYKLNLISLHHNLKGIQIMIKVNKNKKLTTNKASMLKTTIKQINNNKYNIKNNQ